MLVKLVDWKDSFTFQFIQEDDDKSINSDSLHLAQNTATFKIPCQCKHTHPDLIALSAILLAYPFFKSHIKLPFAVSKKFSDTLFEVTKRKVSPVDVDLQPRKMPVNGVPSLCYSAGVDSTAALMIMPENTSLFFCDRVIHENTKTLYNKYAALNTVNEIKESGYDMNIVETDFEYIRSKVGFPTDLSTAVPALMVADQLNIDSVAFGLVMESGYRTGHSNFEDYTQRLHYKRWGALFAAVGCPLYLPVVGISEVGTYMIASHFDTSNTVRSCMRGDQQSSCGKCVKCFRKTLLSAAISNTTIDFDALIRNLNSSEVIRNIATRSIKHENVYRYILNKVDAPPLRHLKLFIEDPTEDVSWMEKWYTPSIELVPSKYQEGHIEKVTKYLKRTSDRDNNYIRSWSKFSQKNASHAFENWAATYKEIVSHNEALTNFLNSKLDSELNS